MRSWKPPAAACGRRTASRCATAPPSASSLASSPWPTLRRKALLQLGPFAIGRGDKMHGVDGELLAVGRVVEQKQPLARDQPHIWPAGDRVVTAIARHINVRPRGECGAVAAVAEAPDHAAVPQFECGAARHRLAVGKEGDRIVTADGKTG